MSELIQQNDNHITTRWKLMASVSALALAACASSVSIVKAEDTDQPQIWIQLDGSFTQLDNDNELLQPDFTLVTPRKPFITEGATGIQKNARATFDGHAQISFQPSGSDWAISLGIRYGRDSRNKVSLQQTPNPTSAFGGLQGLYFAYQNAAAHNSETHIMLDFQASKDMGLGMFGHAGRSAIGVGVRYAQFNSRTAFDIQYHPTNAHRSYHQFYAVFDQSHKFAGVGPEISWNASANIAGNLADGGISLDWGVNAAALFGRQRTHGNHRTVEQFVFKPGYPNYVGYPVYNISASPDRSKSVIVPNLGGFAAISWFYPGAKVSIGYKADFFFNAIDGGIDARKTENRGFYGPYASISIGLGN